MHSQLQLVWIVIVVYSAVCTVVDAAPRALIDPQGEDELVCNSEASIMDGFPNRSVTLDHVSVYFNGGASQNHSIVMRLCRVSSEVPIGKSRDIVSAVGMPCGAAFVTLFGSNQSNVNCEELFDTTTAPCRFSALTKVVSCGFQSSHFPDRLLNVMLRCTQDVDTTSAVVDSGVSLTTIRSGNRLISQLSGQVDCSPPSRNSGAADHALTAADIVVATCLGTFLIVMVYSMGHNYFSKNYRGLDILPWVRSLRRHAPNHPYDPLSQHDGTLETEDVQS